MKIKTGPVVVIIALVVLVGAAMLLTPPPPQAQNTTEQPPTPPPTKKAQKPKLNLQAFKQALASPDPHVRIQGLTALSQAYTGARGTEHDTIGKFILDLAHTKQTEDVRAGLVSMLRNVDGVDPNFLIGIAEHDSSPMVRQAAILSLAKFKPGGAVQTALQALCKDPDPGISSAATISLTQLLSASADDTQLCALLGKFDNDASAKAALALQVRGYSALPALIQTLYHGKTGPQREAAAMVIAMTCAGFNPSINAFARAAMVTHRQIAGHAKANLVALKPLIWALQHDPYAPTRAIAAQGLGYLGDVRAAAPLAKALQDPNRYVRRRAAAALITVPAETVIPQLSEAAVKDSSPDVRGFAVEALGWVGTPAVVPALIAATRDPSADVRRYAAMQLGRIADPQALDALANMLGAHGHVDPNTDVRWAAVVALGKLRDKRAVPVLTDSLNDPSPEVENSAERALQKLGIARKEREGFAT